METHFKIARVLLLGFIVVSIIWFVQGFIIKDSGQHDVVITIPALNEERNPYSFEKVKTESSKPVEILEKMIKVIRDGDLKGAEKYMTQDAINFQLPPISGYLKWTDELYYLLGPKYCKEWKIADCRISGDTAHIDLRFYWSSQDRWLNLGIIMEKENGNWCFDRRLL